MAVVGARSAHLFLSPVYADESIYRADGPHCRLMTRAMKLTRHENLKLEVCLLVGTLHHPSGLRTTKESLWNVSQLRPGSSHQSSLSDQYCVQPRSCIFGRYWNSTCQGLLEKQTTWDKPSVKPFCPCVLFASGVLCSAIA